MKKRLVTIGAVILVVLAAVIGWQTLHQPARSTSPRVARQPRYVEKKKVDLVALGDSLTHGQGDEQKKGGYVGIIKGKIEHHYHQTTVKTVNYGVTGDRSDQILDRLRKQKQIRTDLKKADVITMTVGGNDLMQKLESDALASPKKITKDVNGSRDEYAEKLRQLFTAVRQQNPHAPIFVMSIYNPFYAYFPDANVIDTSITKWNQTTKQTMGHYHKMYFVNIDQLMSYGQYKTKKERQQLRQKEQAANQGKVSQARILAIMDQRDHNINNYISTDDNFHPNHRGYRQIANKLFRSMEHHDSWEYVKR